MNSAMRVGGWFLGIPALLAWSACTSSGSGSNVQIQCGDGTEERNGICVAVVDPSSACGEGTVFNELLGACEPRVECGENTTLNPATGECEPDQVCGPGTVLDPLSGECKAEASCGDGTRFDADAGVCVPVASCGTGTVFNPDAGTCDRIHQCGTGTTLNPDAGTCEFILVCGPDQVEVDGVCYRAGDELAQMADVRESLNDNNDPERMGTPEMLMLKPVGMRTIFTGTISRPIDVGEPTRIQDRDVWRFNGVAGQALRIRVVNAGLPQPAFELTGPNAYRRRSAFNVGVDADRHVVLPYTGAYDLLVAPTVFLATGQPLGSSEAAYIGIIEEVAITPVMVTPGPDPVEPVEVMGNLRAFEGSVWQLDALPGSSVSVNFSSVPVGIVPAVIFLRADDHSVVSSVELPLPLTRAWAAALVPDTGGLLAVLDWVEATGAQDTYVVQHSELPVTQMGDLRSDIRNTTPNQPIYSDSARSYVMDVVEPGVHEFEIDSLTGTSTAFQLDGPAGTLRLAHGSQTLIVRVGEGRHVLHVRNRSVADVQDTLFVYRHKQVDMGTLRVAESQSVTLEAPPLRYAFGDWDLGYVIARADEEGILTLTPHVQSGDPQLQVFDEQGTKIREVDRIAFGRTVSIHAAANAVYLFLVDPASNPGIQSWSVTVQAHPLPEYLEVEPNDIFDTATQLPELPATVLGRMDGSASPAEVDFYQFQLAAPLLPTQAVAIRFDNLMGNTASITSNAARINVLDAAFGQVRSIPIPSTDDAGIQGNNLVAYLGPYDGVGPFYLQVVDETVTGEIDYLLDVRVEDVALEQEPNNDAASATNLGVLPVRAAGYLPLTADDALDVFSVVVPEDASGSRPVRVRLDNVENTTTLKIAFKNELGATAASVVNSDNLHFVLAELPAGTYTVEVANNTTGSATAPMYLLNIDYVELTEVEPNNDVESADDLGVLAAQPLTREASATQEDTDVYQFSLASALVAGQGVLVRLDHHNFASTRVTVQLFNGGDIMAGPPVVTDNNYVATLATSGLTGTGPFTVVVTPAATAVPIRYSLSVSLVGQAEVEPNGTIENAFPVTVLPARILGCMESNPSSGAAELDIYRIQLPVLLAGDEFLRVTVENLMDTSAKRVALRAVDGVTELAVSADNTSTSTVETLPGINDSVFYLVIDGAETTALENDMYELRAEVVHAE